jgi:chromosomal replication initiator protein
MRAWEEFLKRCEEEIGPDAASGWLRTLKVTRFDAGNIYLEAEDAFQADWFEEHIRPRIASSLVNNNHRPIKVHLAIAGVSAEAKRRKGRAAAPLPLASFPPDPLDPWATFAHFVPSDETEVPYKLLSHLDVCDLATFNPIYLFGPSGSGKTHLLMAAASHFNKKGLRTLYVRAETFTDHVVNAIRTGTMRAFREAYRHNDVLLVDNVHVFARRAATQEELFHTFNTLHTARKQIVLSGKTPPHLLTAIEPRLMSRFEWGITLPLEKLPKQGLTDLLFRRSRYLQYALSEEAAAFLTAHFPSATSLLRALDALILRAPNQPARPLHALLADLVEAEHTLALKPETIIAAVAHFYGIQVTDILGKSQSQECSLPRQLAMHLCRTELHMPYTKIGYVFSRDHSTVITATKQIERKLEEQDKELMAACMEIRRGLDQG